MSEKILPTVEDIRITALFWKCPTCSARWHTHGFILERGVMCYPCRKKLSGPPPFVEFDQPTLEVARPVIEAMQDLHDVQQGKRPERPLILHYDSDVEGMHR